MLAYESLHRETCNMVPHPPGQSKTQTLCRTAICQIATCAQMPSFCCLVFYENEIFTQTDSHTRVPLMSQFRGKKFEKLDKQNSWIVQILTLRSLLPPVGVNISAGLYRKIGLNSNWEAASPSSGWLSRINPKKFHVRHWTCFHTLKISCA